MASFIINNKKIEHSGSETLFQLAKSVGVYIPSSCKQTGKCKECIIEISEGNAALSKKTIDEKHLNSRFRLACKTTIIDKEAKIISNLLKRPQLKIETTGGHQFSKIELNPVVKRVNNSIISEDFIFPSDLKNILGLAIDIGTTTVVIRVHDLESKEILSTISFENPQRFAGSNVMARIVYDTENKKKELKRILTGYLANTLLASNFNLLEVVDVVVGGNTTMRDLFFGFNVHSIGQSPYQSFLEKELEEGKVQFTSITLPAKKMNIPIHPNANIFSLPIIGGHIGADTSACILAVDLMNETETVVLMDIGTNTEIFIGNKDKVLAVSSPSGPAFEGGGISFGMPALNGAIEKVRIQNNTVEIQTIGDKKPIGICGSGLIDILGELVRNELITETGRFLGEEDNVSLSNNGDITFSENDINLLAQTKGANSAALSILLKKYGIDFNQIDKFYLAGGFGQHIDLEAAIRIGMLPDIPREKYERIGNAAIEGLSIALLSIEKRNQLNHFVKKIKQINLESDIDFFDKFVNGCLFKALK